MLGKDAAGQLSPADWSERLKVGTGAVSAPNSVPQIDLQNSPGSANGLSRSIANSSSMRRTISLAMLAPARIRFSPTFSTRAVERRFWPGTGAKLRVGTRGSDGELSVV